MKDRSASTLGHGWISRASTVQLAAIATLCGLTLWVLIAGLDLLAMEHNPFATVSMSTVDSLVGLGCGALLFRLMLAERARQQRMISRLHMIAEINHHIRNALDRIELTAHISHNQQLIADIDGGVQRIQWALEELLPEKEPDEDSQ